MVGPLRRAAQSLVGASNTTSTSPWLTASRLINFFSASSTSEITVTTLARRRDTRN